jgi:tetratricopeptide (TPR) repeat protein
MGRSMSEDQVSETQTIWNEARDYALDGDYDKAIEIYKYILIRYADDDVALEHAHAYLGDVYLTSRKLQQAIEHLIKAINLGPDKLKYHYLLGFAYSVRGRWVDAVVEFQLAVDGEPDNPEYLRGLGWAVFNDGNRVIGLEYLLDSLDKDPDNVNVIMDVASAYLLEGDFGKAWEYGEKAVQMDPGNAHAMRVLERISHFHQMMQNFDSREP